MRTTRLPFTATALFNSFSQVFLQRHVGFGFLMLLSIVVAAPETLWGAVIGALTSIATAVSLRYAHKDIGDGLYGYNGVLLGILVANVIGMNIAAIFWLLFSCALMTPIQHRWMHYSRQSNWLPAYTFLFVFFGWLTLLLVQYTDIEMDSVRTTNPNLVLDLAEGARAVLRGVGQVIFMQPYLSGLIITFGLFLASRVSFVWALIASAIGFALGLGWDIATAGALLDEQGLLSGLAGYNPVLVAIALSLIRRPAWQIIVGVLLSLIIQIGFYAIGLSPLTFPFILACWLVLLADRLMCSRKAQATA